MGNAVLIRVRTAERWLLVVGRWSWVVGNGSRFLAARRGLASVAVLAFFVLFSISSAQEDYTFRSESDLVLVNVTVRDKSGSFVRGLTPGDFTILEDGKAQKVVSF